MAITLPDFTALPTVTPQAGGNLLQYPAQDPGAVALAEAGKGTQAAGGALVDIAAYRDIAQTKADRASADADLTNATIPLTEQLKVETDPEKITEIRGKFRAALEAAAGNFTNPEARDFWMKDHAHTVATGQAAADFRNSVVYNDKYNADVQSQINQIVRTGATAEDPVGFGASLVNINSKADAARASGTMTAVQAEAMRQKALADMVTGRVENLIALSRTKGQAKLDEASVLVDQYTNEIGALQAGHLRDRIAGRAETVGGEDLANRSRTAAAADTTAAEHYNYLIANGATPNEAALLTSAAATELGFASTAVHDAAELAKRGLPPGYGLYGHNDTRLTAMQKEAGTARPTWQQQSLFALKELRGRPEGAAVNAAKTDQELTDLQLQFERPSPAGERRAQRLATTRQYMTNPPTAAVPGAPGPAAPAAAPVTPPAPGAAASRTPPTVTAGGGRPPIEVRGDSLGVGLKGRLSAGGNAVGGAQPQAIFDEIKTEPEDHWQGQTVVLSSGTNGNQMKVVEDTMQYLKNHKANVIVVGYGTKYPAKLAHLTEIATRLNIPLVEAEDDDGTHPSPRGYQRMADKIQKAAAGFTGAPAASAAVPKGLEVPGNIPLP